MLELGGSFLYLFSVHGWTNYRIEAFHLSMQYNYVMSPRQAEQLV